MFCEKYSLHLTRLNMCNTSIIIFIDNGGVYTVFRPHIWWMQSTIVKHTQSREALYSVIIFGWFVEFDTPSCSTFHKYGSISTILFGNQLLFAQNFEFFFDTTTCWHVYSFLHYVFLCSVSALSSILRRLSGTGGSGNLTNNLSAASEIEVVREQWKY
jgi:hypothetical protein